jgi:hypothetical protein
MSLSIHKNRDFKKVKQAVRILLTIELGQCLIGIISHVVVESHCPDLVASWDPRYLIQGVVTQAGAGAGNFLLLIVYLARKRCTSAE